MSAVNVRNLRGSNRPKTNTVVDHHNRFQELCEEPAQTQLFACSELCPGRQSRSCRHQKARLVAD